jgi:hypothetical protein
LEELFLSRSKIPNIEKSLQKFLSSVSIPSLRTLDLTGLKGNGFSLNALFANFPNLEIFVLNEFQSTGSLFAQPPVASTTKLPLKLTKFSIARNSSFDFPSLTTLLENCQKLRVVDFSYCAHSISNQVLEILAENSHDTLEEISIFGCLGVTVSPLIHFLDVDADDLRGKTNKQTNIRTRECVCWWKSARN